MYTNKYYTLARAKEFVSIRIEKGADPRRLSDNRPILPMVADSNHDIYPVKF